MHIEPTHIEQSGPGVDLANFPQGLSIRMSDPVKDFQYARNAVTLVYDLSAHERVRLAFEAREFGDEPHAPPPEPFGDDVDFDGVAVSTDGMDWHEVQNLRHLRSDRFAAHDLDLDAAMAGWGLSYGSQFRVRFCQVDNNPAPMDGIFLHRIELTAEFTELVFHLPMDDRSDSPLVRDAAEGRDQTFLDPGGDASTAAHATAGPVGGALAFDGVDDRIVVDLQQGLGNVFGAGNDFTLAFWWKAPTIEFSNLYDYVLTGPVTFSYLTNGKYGSVNAIRFLYRRPVDDTVVSTWYDHSNDGLWHHYAVVRQGQTVRLWRDGASDFADIHANNAGSFACDQMILVGHPDPEFFAPGAMDDFRLYGRPLTEGEIQKLCELGS